MVQTPIPQTFTLEQYLNYDDGTDLRYELENGNLMPVPTESSENNRIAQRLYIEFLKYFPYYRIAYKDTEIAIKSSQALCRLPDLMVHSPESYTAIADQARAIIRAEMPPPLIVIEVVSPGAINNYRDYNLKHSEYAQRGILEYWIVDPQENKVTLCTLSKNAYNNQIFMGSQSLQSQVVSQLQLTPQELFNPVCE
jgi:Uma2 family endonuclease